MDWACDCACDIALISMQDEQIITFFLRIICIEWKKTKRKQFFLKQIYNVSFIYFYTFIFMHLENVFIKQQQKSQKTSNVCNIGSRLEWMKYDINSQFWFSCWLPEKSQWFFPKETEREMKGRNCNCCSCSGWRRNHFPASVNTSFLCYIDVLPSISGVTDTDFPTLTVLQHVCDITQKKTLAVKVQ